MSEDTQIIDAEIVSEPHAPQTPASGTGLAIRERRSEVIRPLDLTQVVDAMKAYQDMLPKLLHPSDYQATGDGKQFVKKSGWRKVATAMDLDVSVVPGMSRVERDENGQPIRAEVWIRATAPSGRFFEADGYCDVSEPRFAKQKARQKLENDLRATASTRATNRAISGLVGMGDVSAEEIDAATESAPAGPPYGPEADEKLLGQARGAVAFLLGVPREEARESQLVTDTLARVMAKTAGPNGEGVYMPRICALAIGLTAAAVKDVTVEIGEAAA